MKGPDAGKEQDGTKSCKMLSSRDTFEHFFKQGSSNLSQGKNEVVTHIPELLINGMD